MIEYRIVAINVISNVPKNGGTLEYRNIGMLERWENGMLEYKNKQIIKQINKCSNNQQVV